MKNMRDNREFLKSGDWNKWGETETDQRRKIPMPDLQKGYSEDALKIDLINPEDFTIGNVSLIEVINKRKSRRKYTVDYLTFEELSYLLWTTQGVKKENKSRRTVPSGGARHSFETHLYIQRVKDVKPGLYRYLPLEHKLLFLAADDNLAGKITAACNNQEFVGESAVTFINTVALFVYYAALKHRIIHIFYLCKIQHSL